MRKLLTAAIFASLTTFVVALSMRAPDAAVALIAVAAVTVLITWFAVQHSTEDDSGLALSNPAATVALTLAGRSSTAIVLPLIAAQVVGAVLGGLGARALSGKLGETLIWAEPSIVGLIVVLFVLGVVATWLLFAIDIQISEGFAAIPPILTGAALPVVLVAALNPAVMLGLASGNLLSWRIALAAAATGLIAAIIGTYSARLIAPTPEHVIGRLPAE